MSLDSGAPVAQWVKRWPTDLAVLGSSPALSGDLFNRKPGATAHSLALSLPIVLI